MVDTSRAGLYGNWTEQAEHCRHLTTGQFDERTRLILKTMADEFDRQAHDIDTTAQGLADNA
jgi:hypothetical protein